MATSSNPNNPVFVTSAANVRIDFGTNVVVLVLVLGLFSIFVVTLEFTVSSPKVSIGKVMVFTCSVWLVAYAVFFFTEITAVLSSAIFVTLVGMMLHIHFVKVDHESLLVIGSLGIQVSSSYASGRETTTFIEMSKIKDIVINEAIYMHQIIYYLCVLLKDPSEPNAVSSVVPLFQSSKPRLNCLLKVYKSCQEILSKC